MRRRQVLALSIAAVAGCTGSNLESGGSDETTTDSTQSATSTTSTTTTREPCSTDLSLADPPEKPDDISAAAAGIVEAVERPVARAYFEPDGAFHFSMGRVSTSSIDDGVRLETRVEVDFSSSGDSENATTVHYHLFYNVTYRLTDRRVVRAVAEQGPTGTVVCW